MRLGLAALLVVQALLVSCSSDRVTAPPPPSLAPQGQASADLRLNAQKSGAFDCTGGLFFVTSVLNQTNAPLRVEALSLTFTKVAGDRCVDHAALISPEAGVSVPPGVSTEIRRVDLAGELCGAPYGEPGCEWLGKATVATSFGTLTDEIAFRSNPAPQPAPAPPANRQPSVSIGGGGSCHPKVGEPCRVSFFATARDPDGDRLSYAWSGCADGTIDTALCIISAPGTFTASVRVSDGRGGTANASARAEGVNQPPIIHFGSPRPPDPAPSNRHYTLVGGQPEDPDDGTDPNQLCRMTTVTASGPCRTGFTCGGVGDVFDVDVTTFNGPGTCVLEVRVRDVWGAVGTDRVAFGVSPP